jgi:hypothetical protein
MNAKKSWADYTPDAEEPSAFELPQVPLLGPDGEGESPQQLAPQHSREPADVFQSSLGTPGEKKREYQPTPYEMAHLLGTLLNPMGGGGDGSRSPPAPSPGAAPAGGSPTAPPFRTGKTIGDLGVPREKIKLLIRTLFENSKEKPEAVRAGKPPPPKKTYWDSLRLWLWTSVPKSEESAFMELYLPNIPLVVGEAEIAQLVEISEAEWDPNNVGDSLHALETIGFFDDPALVQAYSEDVGSAELSLALKHRAERFAETTINLVKIAAVARIFPFAKDLNDRVNLSDLYRQCIGALDLLLEEGRRDGQLKATLKRVVRAYLIKHGAHDAPDSRAEMEAFYSMKENQDVEALSVDSFFYRKNCPLFTRYGHPKVLGAGAYGIVLRYLKDIPESASAPPEEYAVKMQRITTEELKDLRTAAYVELRLLYEVNRCAPQLRRAPGANKSFANHVYLHDWVRCRFNARDRLVSIMTDRQRDQYKDFLQDRQGIYQIYVEEFIAGGTLLHLMTSGAAAFERLTRPEAFAASMVQIFAHLQTLGNLIKFSHKDMKPENILVQITPPDTQIKYLVYEGTSRGTLYVPLAHTDGYVMKVADYGRGRAEVDQEEPGGASRRIQIGQTASAAYNPGHDVEDILLMYLAAMLQQTGDEIHERVDRSVLAAIRAGIHPDHPKLSNAQALSDYGALVSALDRWLRGKPAADDWTRLQRVIYRCYGEHLFLWEDAPRSADIQAFSRMLAHPSLDRYSVKPKDLSSKNSVVMNNYTSVARNRKPQGSGIPATVAGPDPSTRSAGRVSRPVTRSMTKKGV